MAKSRNNVSGINRFSNAKTSGSSTAELSLISQSEKLTATGSQKLIRLGDLKSIATSSIVSATGINFGKPSSTSTKTSQSGSQWSGILKNAASGGLANAFGGSLLDLGGISSIFSGFSSLFGGGKNTPAALVQYQQPLPQNQTISVDVFGASKRAGVTGSQAVSNSSHGIYGSGQTTAAPFQYQSTQISQAVKQALLSSSSLNDVIAEIQ